MMLHNNKRVEKHEPQKAPSASNTRTLITFPDYNVEFLVKISSVRTVGVLTQETFGVRKNRLHVQLDRGLPVHVIHPFFGLLYIPTSS